METKNENRTKRKPINRFDLYQPDAPYSKPKLTGIINNDNDYELGTPSLDRKENITFIASSTTYGDSLRVNFKWRPYGDSQFVCLITKFQLSLEKTNKCYEHEGQIIYRPNKSKLRFGRITQYGSPQSNLKLFINAPYRRLRITFRGLAKNKILPEDSKFIKANFIIASASGIFDFMAELPHNSIDAPKTKDTALKERFRLANDRHEQLIQMKGEYTIEETTEDKVCGSFMGWGFHVRQFVHATNEPTHDKRILILLALGRAYHFGQLTHSEHHNEFAAACSDLDTSLKRFTRPYSIEWSKIDCKSKEFELQLETNRGLAKAKASRKAVGEFYDIEIGNHKGWAWIAENDGFDLDEETDKWQANFIEYQTALNAGKFANSSISPEEPYIVDIDDPVCTSGDLVGSKASSLAQLHAYSKICDCKYEVAPAFVLTRFVYAAILGANDLVRKSIQKLETMVGESHQPKELQSECKQLVKVLSEAKIPENVQKEVTSKLHHHCNGTLEQRVFAVRSSSWGEDEEDMSAAGQLDTILGVTGLDAILRAIMRCFASKFAYANVEYKRNHGLGLNLPMAVIVQEMIDCDKAGVLFTCDPTTGNAGVATITANYGLGESVVSGKAEPDCIKVRVRNEPEGAKEVEVEKIEIGHKQIIYDSMSCQAAAEGIGEEVREEANQGAKEKACSTKEYDNSKCCLEHNEILQLARCGLSLSVHYQGPRDIEWGYKGSALYLFQSRPVTGLDNYTELELLHEADLASRRELDFFTRANVGEVKPYATNPLSSSYADRFWCLMRYAMNPKMRYSPEANQQVYADSYHVFLSLLNGILTFSRDENGEKPIEAKTMDYALFGHEVDDPELDRIARELDREGRPPKWLVLLFTLSFRLAPSRAVAKHRKILERAHVDVANCKYASGYKTNRLLGLLRQVEHVVDVGVVGVRNHGNALYIGNEYNSRLSKVLAKYISDPVKVNAAQAKILALNPGVISAEIPQRIESLASMVVDRNSNLEVEKFIQMSTIEALEFIKTCNAELASEFECFINRFGHRSYNEFDLATHTWRDRPEEIAEMVQRNCKSIIKRIERNNTAIKDETGSCEPEEGTKRSDAMNIDQIIDSLQINMSLKDRLLLKYDYIPKCQRFVGIREQTKDVFVSHNDLMRKATRMLAKELRRILRIPDEDLIFYLFYDELEPLVREPQPALIMQATRRRNLFRKHFREPWKFDELIRAYDITPIHKMPSAALDQIPTGALELKGTPASSGRVRGKVCLVTSYDQLDKVRSGCILVAHSTDIGYSPVFPLLLGIITEVGGLVSHGAVVAREYGLPSVLGVPRVTRILKDGDEIVLDADNGLINRL